MSGYDSGCDGAVCLWFASVADCVAAKFGLV